MWSSYSLAFLFVLIAVVLVLLLRAGLRRFLGDKGGGHAVSTAIEPLAGVYGLLIAFLIGGVADRALDLRNSFQQEAETFERVDQIAQRMPPSIGPQLRHSLETYAQLEMASRAGDPTPVPPVSVLNQMWISLASFEPSRPSEEALKSEMLTELRLLRQERRIASTGMRYAHNPLIWLVLIVGSITVIVVCAVASLGDPRGAFYVAAVTVVIVITLYALHALSQPVTSMPFR